MKEGVLNFGPDGALVGVLTRPADAEATRDLAVLFLNAGVLHRVGPNRIHVRLARSIVGEGIPSFRFDLPGIGDSRGLGGAGSLLEENVRAISIALDTLEGRGIARQFVLFGLCSGADHAFVAACADPRVVGMVVVDPTREYPTPRSHAIRVCNWIRRPDAWLRLFSGQYQVLRRIRDLVVSRVRPSGPESAGTSQADDKERISELLRGLVTRRVQACYVMTGLGRPRYEYAEQLFDAFPGLGLESVTQVARFPLANHTFPSEESRRLLENVVVDWLRTTPFAAPVPSSEGDGLGAGAKGGPSAGTS